MNASGNERAGWGVPPPGLLWAARSENSKTGDIPTGWVGRTAEETMASCHGCPLAPPSIGGSGACYAHAGAVKMAVGSVQRSARADPGRYSLARALASRRHDARAVRLGAIGDPARVAWATVAHAARVVRAAGLALLSYTHHWREREAAAWAGLGRLPPVHQRTPPHYGGGNLSDILAAWIAAGLALLAVAGSLHLNPPRWHPCLWAKERTMETIVVRTGSDELALSIPIDTVTLVTLTAYPGRAGGYLSIHGTPAALRALLADALAAIERTESDERAALDTGAVS